jgi:hypothetical protein
VFIPVSVKNILAVHSCVDLLARHDIDVDAVEQVLSQSYGEDPQEEVLEFMSMLVGQTSRPRLHAVIEAGFLKVFNTESGWNSYMSNQAQNIYEAFITENSFLNRKEN